MKFSSITFFTILCFLFIACEKSEWDKDKEDFDKECFELIYPVSYLMPDGTSISGEEEEIEDNIKAWYEANPDSEEKPQLLYPVEVIFEEDIVKGIANEEEMLFAFENCYEDKEECFELVFPLTYIMPDGTALNGENGDDLEEAMKAWYEANPNAEEEKAELQYPVEIIFDDESIDTINSDEELVAAYESCEDGE